MLSHLTIRRKWKFKKWKKIVLHILSKFNLIFNSNTKNPIKLLINYQQRRVTSNPLHNDFAKLYSKFKLQTKNLHPYT
jgi:hypothetical protein